MKSRLSHVFNFYSQNGDVCKDCTQIFELLLDLMTNPDLQVSTMCRKHIPEDSYLLSDIIIHIISGANSVVEYFKKKQQLKTKTVRTKKKVVPRIVFHLFFYQLKHGSLSHFLFSMYNESWSEISRAVSVCQLTSKVLFPLAHTVLIF